MKGTNDEFKMGHFMKKKNNQNFCHLDQLVYCTTIQKT